MTHWPPPITQCVFRGDLAGYFDLIWPQIPI
jgi:hypothetical protein